MLASEIHKSHRKLHYSHSKPVHAETTTVPHLSPIPYHSPMFQASFRALIRCVSEVDALLSLSAASNALCGASCRAELVALEDMAPATVTWRMGPGSSGWWAKKNGSFSKENGDESTKVIQNGHGNAEKMDKNGEIHQRNLKVWATYCKMAQKGKSLTLGFEWILQRTIRRVDRLAANLVVQPTKMAGRRTQWLNHVKSVWHGYFILSNIPVLISRADSDPVAHQWVD